MKIKLLAILVVGTLSSLAQNPTFRIKDRLNGGVFVQNNAVYDHVVSATQTHQHLFTIVNQTNASISISIRKYHDLVNVISPTDSAEAYFCTGTNCLPPSSFNANVTIAAQDTLVFYGDLKEATTAGKSTIRYRIANNAAGEQINFTLRYNATIGLNEITKLFTQVSNVYPNPSKGESFINFKSDAAGQVNVKVVNVLGKTVSESVELVEEGNNKVSLPTTHLASGIYFITLGKNDAIITRKLSIK